MNADKVKAALDIAQTELNGLVDAEYAGARATGNFKGLARLSNVQKTVTLAQDQLAKAVKGSIPKAPKPAKPAAGK